MITGTDKYVDYVVFEYERPGDDDSLFDRVLVVVHAFLTARSTAKCRQMGREKYTQRTRQAFVRVLKQRKRDAIRPALRLQRCIGGGLPDAAGLDRAPLL